MTTLREIVDTWSGCHVCDLASTRQHVVVGSPWRDDPTEVDPLILIVGEAPGRNEDRTGQAFVGQAGQILKADVLKPAGVRLAWITNALACWPGEGNPDPTPDQIQACAPRLDALVETLQPDGLLTVGRISTGVRSYQWRRYFDERPSTSIIHPAALLRQGHPNATTVKTLRAQVQKVKNLLKKLGVTPKDETIIENCDHEFVVAGHWVLPDGNIKPFRACGLCGLLGDS